ncbi:MAG: hypothetical protein KGK08_14390, partial [Acidobacteriota bacterium]|nr:hypothetical protein [Acidobacteriota bacterium]
MQPVGLAAGVHSSVNEGCMQTKAIHAAHANTVSSAVKAPIAKTELPGFAAVLQQASPGFVQALQDASAQTAGPSLSEEPQCLDPKSGQADAGTEAEKDVATQRAALAQVAVAKASSEIAPKANPMVEA